MKRKGLLSICCLLVAIVFQANGQSIVNMTWNQAYGQPDTIDWMATCLDTEDNIIITGNKKAAGGNTNIFTAKFDEDGDLLWIEHYTYTSNQKDYGVAVTTDGNNNIYIAGTSYINSTNGYDFTVIMYDEDGNEEWVSNYNGTGSGDDIATAIAEYDGSVFVTGISKGDTTLEDYVTIKYNSSGVQQWASRYDYTKLVEIPAAIEIDDNGNVLITGASGSSVLNWDITTVLYNNSTGSQISSRRVTGSGYGLNQPADMRKDYLGNIIITGQVMNQQNNYDIKTIKMDANLDTIWTRTYNRDSLDDVPAAMDVDVNGNIYVTGYSAKASGTDMVNLQYDTDGDLTWSHIISSGEPNGSAKGKQIKVDINGNIYATGNMDKDSTIDIITMRYDSTLALTWARYFNGEGNGNDYPWDMIYSNNNKVWVSGISYDGASETYTTIKYSTLDIEREAETDTAGNPLYLKNQIIVSFDTSVVLKQNIDNIDIQWGEADYFLKDTIIEAMEDKLADGVVDNAKYIRIFREMTTSDSSIISRMGDTVSIPPFYTSFKMTLHTSNLEQSTIDSLKTLFPLVKFAEKNHILTYDLQPNDDEFEDGEQGGLYDPTFTISSSANINVLDAWDIEVGKENIDVGIYDSGINYKHEDLGDGTNIGSKVKGGRDYEENCHPWFSQTPDFDGHGSAIAGIIGALRNNNKGMAGIAGGDMNNSSNPGVSLYSFKTSYHKKINGKTVLFTDIEKASDAIFASTTGYYGYKIDVMNFSFGTFEEDQLLRTVVNFAYRYNVTMVASSGNTESSLPRYPGSWDDLVMRVGASDEYGNRASFSNTGEGMDFIAPGKASLYSGLHGDNNSAYSYNRDGTSFSCPHVVGCASLLLSHYKNNPDRPNELSNEDIENILQNYAVDIFPSGEDLLTGWGLIDIGEAMKKVELPKYKIRHYSDYRNSSGKTLIETGKNIEFPEGVSGISNSIGFTGIADVYKLTETFNYTLPVSESKIDLWVRNASSKATFGYYDDGIIKKYPFNSLKIEEEGQNFVKLTCYLYDVDIYNSNNQLVDTKWFPGTNNIKFAYSIHTIDNSYSIKDVNNDGLIKVFPNPTNKRVNIEININDRERYSIQLFDIQGRLVYSTSLLNQMQEESSFALEMEGYKNGVYIIKISSQKNVFTKKIIKYEL
jgi:hypothetical protein